MPNALQIRRLCLPAAMLFAVLGLTLWGCESEKPVLIGFVNGTSGRVADFGISARDAVQMAVDECNRSGGIRGRKVQLIMKDDQQNPEIARKAVRELINQGVVAIIGPGTSQMAVSVISIANEAQTVLISSGAATEQLTGKDDYFFRVASTTSDYASRLSRFLTTSSRTRRVALALDDNNPAYARDFAKYFQKFFSESGGEVTAIIGFGRQESRTFMQIARGLLTENPDGVVVAANSVDAALLCQQIRKLDPKIRISISDYGATERLLEMGGKAMEGVTLVVPYNPSLKTPRFQQFRKLFILRYQRDPGFGGVNSFNAALVLFEALRVQKKGQDLKQALLSKGSFEGLQGPIELTRFGDLKNPRISMDIIKDQKIVVIE